MGAGSFRGPPYRLPKRSCVKQVACHLRPCRASSGPCAANVRRWRMPSDAPLLITAKETAALCGVSPATWHRLVAASKTPAAVRLSRGLVRWRISEIEAWIAAGCAERAKWERVGEEGHTITRGHGVVRGGGL